MQIATGAGGEGLRVCSCARVKPLPYYTYTHISFSLAKKGKSVHMYSFQLKI